MEFERRFMTENENYVSSTEVRPKGIIVYSSGFPVDRSNLFKIYNRAGYRASVHALVDFAGVTQTLDLHHRAWHSGTETGNSYYLGIVVCEPNPLHPEYVTLRGQTYSNLVQYLVFLCRYWELDPINESEVIQLAGTAYANKLVAQGQIDAYARLQPYFYEAAVTEVSTSTPSIEGSIKTAVSSTLGQIAGLYAGITPTTETPLSQIGTGDVVLFTGGELFKSHGTSLSGTSVDRMLHGVVASYSPGSRHPYEVVFPNGSSGWVNKSTLVRSTLGNIRR